MKGFALGLALKQRRNATRKSPKACIFLMHVAQNVRGSDLYKLVRYNNVLSQTTHQALFHEVV